MSTFDDSWGEMHDDSLSPDTADRLLDGENLSPEFADLAALVADVRSVPGSTPTPAVSGPLAEYIGVGLTEAEIPAVVSDGPRRKNVIAEALAFAGTVSGKLLIGGAVAAASVTGAQATGVVDIPGLPDAPSTVVVADEPVTELPLIDDSGLVSQIPEEPVEAELVEEPVEDEKVEEKTEEKAEDEKVEEPVEDEKAEEKTEEKAEEPVEDEKVEEKTEEKADEPVEDKKTEEPVEDKKTEEPVEDKKTEDKPAEDPNAEAIAALQAQLAIDKEAVYAAADVAIAPLAADKKVLVEALNTTLGNLETARNDAKAPLYAELETTTDEARKAEIEAELTAIFEQWELDRDAAIADASPAIAELESQIATIETDRDAEITRLLEEYQAAIDALPSNK